MKQIRKDLHLSQQDLALLLNVSRSAISLYESGMRSMPSKATTKWLRLQELWNQNQKRRGTPRIAPGIHLKLQQEQSMARLNAHLQRAAARTISISQQLSQMEERHRQLAQKLQFLKGLMQEARPGTRRMDLLKNREQMVLIQLAACCPERRQLLAFRLQVLHTQQKAALASKVILQQQQSVNTD